MMTSVHVTCIIRCPHLYQKQQSPQAPSRRPCTAARASQIPTRLGSTYGHTPDAFPHTFWQIPIGRPSPHTIYKLFKIGFSFDETSGSSSTNPNQPRQANILDLRYTSANQAPASSSKSHIPASGGHRHLLHVRPWSCAHLHGHGHALTFKGTCTAMVMRARSFTCTAIVIHARPRQRPGTLLTRPAYGSHGSSANPVHSSALRLRNISADLRVQPAYSKPLGGMGMASTTTASLRRL